MFPPIDIAQKNTPEFLPERHESARENSGRKFRNSPFTPLSAVFFTYTSNAKNYENGEKYCKSLT
jgi:hypothetical protein